jgi:hypothetical protein
MSYTPEFKPIIELASSPVALLVALWGMASKATLQGMKSSKRDKTLAINLIQAKNGQEN